MVTDLASPPVAPRNFMHMLTLASYLTMPRAGRNSSINRFRSCYITDLKLELPPTRIPVPEFRQFWAYVKSWRGDYAFWLY